MTSLSSFRSCWSEDFESSRTGASSRQQTLSSGDSEDGSGGDRYSEFAGRPRDGNGGAARPDSPQCFVIHRWRNSTNLDQLVEDSRGPTQGQGCMIS